MLPATARILDAGAWFNPCLAATDIVDVMPYETRRGSLTLGSVPGERFSKSTWRQVDFLQAGLRLPYADQAFDFSICTQTIEDLADPEPLLRELQRVSRAGYIESPSRLSEQTAGVRDRISATPGHPHHHWIVECAGARLELSPKTVSLEGPRRYHVVPL